MSQIEKLLKYAKAHVAIVGALLTWYVATYPSGQWANYAAVILAVLTGLGVLVVPNAKAKSKRKAHPNVGKNPLRKVGRRKPDPKKVARGILDFTPLLNLGAVIPATVDYVVGINWSGTMFGNDEAGDCEAARVGNWLILISTFLGKVVDTLVMDQIWDIYRTQNPKFTPDNNPKTGFGSPADGGMDTQTLLEYLMGHGFDADGNLAPVSATVQALVVAFGTVDPTNIAAVEAAIAAFGGVWIDIIVLDANQTEFSKDEPWTYVAGSAVDGGHAVLGGAYIPQRRFITWADIAEFADSFWEGSVNGQPLVESVWIPVHPDHLGSEAFLAGVDGDALASEFTALTGKPFPAVTPPAPTPVPPTPTPVAGDV